MLEMRFTAQQYMILGLGL